MLKQIACALALIVSSVAGTNAATLTFDNACGIPCSNGGAISQSYGDIAGVDVEYDGNPGAPGLEPFLFWDSAYSDLTNVAYYADGATLSFLSTGSLGVTLSSLDLGAWPNTNRSLGFLVTDLATNTEVFNTGLLVVSGLVRSSFSPNLFSNIGLQITFFGDFFNGGVDNVVYSAGGSTVVPLPAALPLMAGGLGLLGLMGWRRKRAA